MGSSLWELASQLVFNSLRYKPHNKYQNLPHFKYFLDLLEEPILDLPKFSFLTKICSLGTATGIRCLPKIFLNTCNRRSRTEPKWADPRCEKNQSLNVNSILTPMTSFGALFLGHVYVMARLGFSSRMFNGLVYELRWLPTKSSSEYSDLLKSIC